MATKGKGRRSVLASGRKELQELIETCDAISQRKFNPFFLDVNLGVETLRQYFPYWEDFDDHCRDAHTLNRLSEVVRLQNTQLKFQSSALYAEPEFIAKKIERMSEKRLAEVFLQSWHPLAELEQLTDRVVGDAINYWNMLLPIAERWKQRDYARGTEPGRADSGTLTVLGIEDKEFGKRLVELWGELRQLYLTTNKAVDYWEFVGAGTYQLTVQRAYFVSFLVTYGYASLRPDGEKMTLIPLDKPSEKAIEGGISFPIPIPREAITLDSN
jgi:hypothetical protein